MRLRLIRSLMYLLVLVLGYGGWSGYLIWTFGKKDHAQPADCVVVLGAAAYGMNPSPVFRQRILHAIALYQQGLVKKIVFTGGYGEGARYAESEVAARFARFKGISPQDILLETHSHTTQQNLKEAKLLMLQKGLKSAIIVSDPLHLKRTATIAKELEINAFTSPTPTSRYRSLKAKFVFLLREIFFLHHYLLIR